MTKAPRVHWLDAMLRKLFNTPVPTTSIERPVVSLSPDYEDFEERLSGLTEANRALERTSYRWQAAFLASNAYSYRLSRRSQKDLARELTEILGTTVVAWPKPTAFQKSRAADLAAEGLVPRARRPSH